MKVKTYDTLMIQNWRGAMLTLSTILHFFLYAQPYANDYFFAYKKYNFELMSEF